MRYLCFYVMLMVFGCVNDDSVMLIRYLCDFDVVMMVH